MPVTVFELCDGSCLCAGPRPTPGDSAKPSSYSVADVLWHPGVRCSSGQPLRVMQPASGVPCVCGDQDSPAWLTLPCPPERRMLRNQWLNRFFPAQNWCPGFSRCAEVSRDPQATGLPVCVLGRHGASCESRVHTAELCREASQAHGGGRGPFMEEQRGNVGMLCFSPRRCFQGRLLASQGL